VPGALRPAIVGVVVSRETREPLSDVVVRVLDENGEAVDETLTDVEGLFRMLLDEGYAEAYLSVERLGYTRMAEELGISLVDLNEAPLKKLAIEDCPRFPEMVLPEIAFTHYLISVPVLKAHPFKYAWIVAKRLPRFWITSHSSVFGVDRPLSEYKRDGRWENPPDPDRVAALMERVTQLRRLLVERSEGLDRLRAAGKEYAGLRRELSVLRERISGQRGDFQILTFLENAAKY